MDLPPEATAGQPGASESRPSAAPPRTLRLSAKSRPRTSASLPSKQSTNISLSLSFPPLSQPNTSFTSLIPSTAEGKPIPLDNGTAASRTSTLREISTNYPARHPYAKSTGTQSTTYSQPVLVRTYSGSPSQQSSTSRSVQGEGRKPPLRGGSSSVISGPAASVRRIIALRTPFQIQDRSLLSMARAKAKQGVVHQGPAKLPPIEAYSFKSMMASLESGEDENTINSDLDRIAEICARSRYSLSNQYEVHMAPHGSGTAFLASASTAARRQQHQSGPTLQAVGSDDERTARRHRKRRSLGGRRKSVAVGTLETIMSSSGSSEDGKAKKKKSAMELAEEIRGRTVNKTQPEISTETCFAQSQPQPDSTPNTRRGVTRKKSAVFASALMENARLNQGPADMASPRSSANTLLSDISLPETSTSHLEVRTEPDQWHADKDNNGALDGRVVGLERRTAQDTKSEPPREPSQETILGGLKGWMPTWSFPPALGLSSASAAGDKHPSYAEGSLRNLLQSGHGKGKGKALDRPS